MNTLYERMKGTCRSFKYNPIAACSRTTASADIEVPYRTLYHQHDLCFELDLELNFTTRDYLGDLAWAEMNDRAFFYLLGFVEQFSINYAGRRGPATSILVGCHQSKGGRNVIQI